MKCLVAVKKNNMLCEKVLDSFQHLSEPTQTNEHNTTSRTEETHGHSLELYQPTKLNTATATVCFAAAPSLCSHSSEHNGNNHLILRFGSAGDYGWWEEVHVPEKPARYRVSQCRQAQRHTEGREKSCARVAWPEKGQRMFPLLLPLHRISRRLFFYLPNYICILGNSKWLRHNSHFGFAVFFNA